MRTPLAKCTLTKVSHELPGGKAATSTLGSARFDHKLTSSLTMCNVAHATRVIFTVWTGTKALAWAGCKLVEVNGVRSGVLPCGGACVCGCSRWRCVLRACST